MDFSFKNFSIPSIISIQTEGSIKFAVPTCIAVAPAIINSVVAGIGKLTVIKGDNPRGAAEDLVLNLTGATNIVKLDTGYYVQGTGTNKGAILVKGAATGMTITPIR